MWTKDEPRQRLRAPDEAEGDARLATATDGGGGAGLHGGFRSPEYIEERLENLKRRPAWGAFLDEYVDAHADDDHDEADVREALVLALHSLLAVDAFDAPDSRRRVATTR